VRRSVTGEQIIGDEKVRGGDLKRKTEWPGRQQNRRKNLKEKGKREPDSWTLNKEYMRREGEDEGAEGCEARPTSERNCCELLAFEKSIRVWEKKGTQGILERKEDQRK